MGQGYSKLEKIKLNSMQKRKDVKKFKDLLFFLTAKFGSDGVVETKLMKLLYFAEANFYKKIKKLFRELLISKIILDQLQIFLFCKKS